MPLDGTDMRREPPRQPQRILSAAEIAQLFFADYFAGVALYLEQCLDNKRLPMWGTWHYALERALSLASPRVKTYLDSF
jgi:hypothetical protein